MLQSYLDAELDETRRRQIADHLDACLRCSLEADTYIRLRFALALRGIERELAEAEPSAIERLRRFALALTQEESS